METLWCRGRSMISEFYDLKSLGVPTWLMTVRSLKSVEPSHVKPLFDKSKLYSTTVNYSDDQNYTVAERDQINMAYAIKSADINWLREHMFDAGYHSQEQMCQNYQLFKSVFVWILPSYPVDCKLTNRLLCRILSHAHTIDEIFYHWSWYVFPRILEHFEFMEDAITFLIEASQSINRDPHVWEGHPDKDCLLFSFRFTPFKRLAFGKFICTKLIK